MGNSGSRQQVDYAVAFVDDSALREDDWVFVEVNGTLVFLIRENAVTPENLAAAWGAFRAMAAQPAA